MSDCKRQGGMFSLSVHAKYVFLFSPELSNMNINIFEMRQNHLTTREADPEQKIKNKRKENDYAINRDAFRSSDFKNGDIGVGDYKVAI